MTRTTDAWVSGFIGIAIFSGSLPATRLAVAGFSPVFLTSARAIIAAVFGAALLLGMRQKRPTNSEMRGLAVVALGVVIGYPLLTAIALQFVPSARTIVFVGLLPLATALCGVWRAASALDSVFGFSRRRVHSPSSVSRLMGVPM